VKSLPFRWKLILFIVSICGVSLSLAFVGLYLYDLNQSGADVERRVEATSRLAIDTLAPLLSQEPAPKDLPLSSLGANEQIVALAVYSTKNDLIAHYIRPGVRVAIPQTSQQLTNFLGTERGVFWTPIRSGGRTLGILYLKAQLTEADLERSSNLIRGSLIIFLAAVLLAFMVAYRLQGLITRPITELARVSGDIQRERDYSSHRVEVSATGEIGALIESFNAMLDTIQSNTSELKQAKVIAEEARERIRESNEQLEEANRTLEGRVEDRTKLLAKAVKDAEEASKAKSSFLAKMSHELRTPLNAIIGYSEMLQEDARDDGNTRTVEDLDKVLSAARHLLGLINDVLDISKIEAGKMELFLESFEITKLVKEVTTTVSPLIEKKANRLVVECPADIGRMHADATKIRQILLNLLSNASKFTEHGTITLRLSRTAASGRDLIEMAIIDTGIGMTPEQLSRLFQAFSQADASTTSKYGGTGLGLAISKQFAQMMQGNITVTSVPGTGSTFTVRLPVEVQKEEPKVVATLSHKLTKSPFPTETRPRILIIDDDQEMRKLIAELLAQSGYEIYQAAAGQQGLDLAHEVRPALILLDVMMPGMDGWTVLTKLQNHPQLTDIPVIMLSAVNDADMALTLGAATVLLKPIDAERLTAEIAMLLAPLSSCYVLFVEDDLDSRTLVTRMLEKEGWQFRTASNGLAALRMLKQGLPAALILDLKMPGMNGFELLETMQKNPAWAGIPVIILSSMDLTKDMKEFLSPRSRVILSKTGITREQLTEWVRPAIQACALAKN
jgi:signal transduction histidine kinase/DNA-binding response OmpR family regulator